MFGYVRPDKAELKIKDYETYKAVYCSLCRTLGKEYGLFARFFLTFDATFYIFVMKTVFQQNSDCAHRGICRFNPLKKCNYIDDDRFLHDAAALTVIMFYYKIRDNLYDSGFSKKIMSFIVLPYISLKFKKALKEYSQFNEIIKTSIEEQNKLEDEFCDSVDKACDPSAKALEKIFTLGIDDEETKRIVARVSYCLGRWVYLMDAFDDLEKDIKKKSYNPFIEKFNLNKDFLLKYDFSVEENIVRSIRLTANETAAAFELLEKKSYKPITENIIFDGMENELQKIIKKKKTKRGEPLNE